MFILTNNIMMGCFVALILYIADGSVEVRACAHIRICSAKALGR